MGKAADTLYSRIRHGGSVKFIPPVNTRVGRRIFAVPLRENFWHKEENSGETGRKGMFHRERVIACPHKDKQKCRKSFDGVVKFKSTTRQSGRILSK